MRAPLSPATLPDFKEAQMDNWEDRLAARLDQHRPGWWALWADQRDLADLALGWRTEESIRKDVARQLFHTILHAALAEGIVEDKTKETKHEE